MSVAEEMEQRLALRKQNGADCLDTEGVNQVILMALRGDLFKQSPKTEGPFQFDGQLANSVMVVVKDFVADGSRVLSRVETNGVHASVILGGILKIEADITLIK